jgi:hypothetical protein
MAERAGDNYEEQEQKMVTGESDERSASAEDVDCGMSWKIIDKHT